MRHYVFPRPRQQTIWSEEWQAPDQWLKSITSAIAKSGAIIKPSGDFDRWDLEARGGLFGAARLRMGVEEHGGGKQLVRFGTWNIVSPTGLMLIILFALLSFLAAIHQSGPIAVLFGVMASGLAIHVFLDCAAAAGIFQYVICTQEELKTVDSEGEKKFVLRKKVRKGILFIDFDRRQNRNSDYSGSERRSNDERRRRSRIIRIFPKRPALARSTRSSLDVAKTRMNVK